MSTITNWREAANFSENNNNAKEYLTGFRQMVRNIKDGEIKNPAQLKNKFGKRFSHLRGNRFCIDIGGTKIRTIVLFEFNNNTMDIRWVGWHKEYDRLCKAGLQYTV